MASKRSSKRRAGWWFGSLAIVVIIVAALVNAFADESRRAQAIGRIMFDAHREDHVPAPLELKLAAQYERC